MQEIEKIAENLFEKIRSRFENVSLGDENAQATSDPTRARFFNFDYVTDDDQNHGNLTISIIGEDNLKVYFSKNISDKLDEAQKKQWYEFLYDLRKFARRNLMVFDTRDVSRGNINIKDIKNVSKSDTTYNVDDVAVNEGRMYGTPKTSFENVGNARIRIVHTESVNTEVRGSRARHINAIYIENAQGERFRMEFNKLGGARAMARHISEGGAPYDDIGQHINGMIREMGELGTFVRGMRRRTFEDAVASDMLEAAVNYYNGMHRQLSHLKGPKSYREFVENFQPQETQLDEVDVNEIKDRFVKRIFDDRMEAALPHVYKAYKMQEQSRQYQAEAVKNIVAGKTTLQLATNESMDEYMKMLSFSDSASMVSSVLEDIAARAVTMPEVAEFAAHWAKNWNSLSENDNSAVKENKILATQLATQYIRDLGKLKENAKLRTTTEQTIIDFDRGADLLGEGTWAIPETDADIQALATIMKQPLPLGMDATNATSALYDLVGDDELFDKLGELVNTEGPESDARPTIAYFLEQNWPGIYAKLGLGNNAEMDQEPAPGTPGVPQQPQQPAQNMESSDMASILRLAGLKTIR